MSWNAFFHSRFGPEGMKLIGWLRIFYALLFLADRLCFAADLDFLLSPTHGVLNYRAAQQNPQLDEHMLTLFALAPDSEQLLWGLHYIGIVQGLLLLLGIFPKFQLIGLYVNLLSFQHHNHMLWDGEDRMFKLWAFLFLFFPMHTVTIFDSFGKKIKPNETWSMWPIRLFQLEMTLVYMGASLSKVTSRSWREGTAMYWIAYTTDYYPGVFNPDFLFNKLGPLKLFCWSAIVLEISGWTLVWIPQTRFWAVMGMFALHIGIDLTMNMYAFEWLAMIGWAVFLVQPLPPPSSAAVKNDNVATPVSSTRLNRMGDLVLVVLLSIFTIDAFPMEDVLELVPQYLKPTVSALEEWRSKLHNVIYDPMHLAGLQQGVWNMYTGEYPDHSNCYYTADLFYANGTESHWESPDWMTMPWWQRKRKMRLMNYYDSGEDKMAAASWVAFAKFLQKQYSGKGPDDVVLTVDMNLRCEYGVDYPEDIGWFEPVRQPMVEEIAPMVTLDICGDDFAQCTEWKDLGLCTKYSQGMLLYCQMTCGYCKDGEYIVTWPATENARYVERTGTEIFSEMYDRFPTPDLIGNFEDYDDNEDEEDEDED